MATEKWVAGASAGWASAFGSEVNSLATGNAILSSVAVANGTSLDVFMDVSISLGSITPVSPNFIGIYLYPLNQDGTSYGDGRFGSAAAGPPPSTYYKGNIVLVAAAAAQTGALTGIVLPPGDFKLVLYSMAGVALAASANTIKYRTYNRSIA
jgi:hypothetical protein